MDKARELTDWGRSAKASHNLSSRIGGQPKEGECYPHCCAPGQLYRAQTCVWLSCPQMMFAGASCREYKLENPPSSPRARSLHS